MYLENSDRNREGWKYTYKGSELLPFALKCVDFYRNKEQGLRGKLVGILNKLGSLNSTAMQKTKDQATSTAVNLERCEIFAHEFKRTPDREFQLSAADVVFFGLAGHKIDNNTEED